MKKENKKEYVSDAGVFSIGLTRKEIKMLVFWAEVGLSKAKDGTNYEITKSMVKYFKKHLKIK